MVVYHIAVLECDTPVDSVVTSRGTYGDIFEELLTKGLEGRGPATGDIQLRVSKWDVVGSSSFPDIREVDALLLSGSSEYLVKNRRRKSSSTLTTWRNRAHSFRRRRVDRPVS